MPAVLSHPRRTPRLMTPPMSPDVAATLAEMRDAAERCRTMAQAIRADENAYVRDQLRTQIAAVTGGATDAPAAERILCGTARETSHPWIRPVLAAANKLRREFGGEIVVTLARNPLSGAYTAATFALEMTPDLAARYRAEADELARERADAAALMDRHRENAGLTYEDVSETEAA